MITREQVADLREGDVVEIRHEDYPDVVISGPLSINKVRDELVLGPITTVRLASGRSGWEGPAATLTVVSRTPRPLYVNHDRKRPSIGDVVREEPDEAGRRVWLFDGNDWWFGDGVTVQMVEHDKMPTRLRLLVDGTSGQVVPS